MNLSISIVSNDHSEALKRCLQCLSSNIDPSITREIFVIINLPEDKKSLAVANQYPSVKVIQNSLQKGFSENHNNVIKRSTGESVLIMNPDVMIEKGFVEGALDVFGRHSRVGIVTGKLIRENKNTIDSTGHIIFKNRRTIDRGQGEQDTGQYDRKEEVFSACGAAMLCRREMLEDVKLFGEYFDESFKLYKEDLDLSWRARLRGWKVFYEPRAVAYHDRGWGAGTKRAAVPRWIRRESYKNRYLLMIKNDYLVNFLRDLPFILWHEIKALIYMVLREPHLFLAWPQIISQVPTALRKRAEIMKKAVAKPEEIRKWFV